MTFLPSQLQEAAQELADLLKQREQTICVAETVRPRAQKDADQEASLRSCDSLLFGTVYAFRLLAGLSLPAFWPVLEQARSMLAV